METKVAFVLLNRIFRGNVVLVPKNTRQRNVVRASSLERELARRLREFFENRRVPERIPAIMTSLPEEAILAFARRNALPVQNRKKDHVDDFIERLQERSRRPRPHSGKTFVFLDKQPGKRGNRIN